uniref:Uncharacterized protein n=1 Tax=Rhizophora mucronata TaxID=61149 RepID=A0A2P2R3U0_RHIMU
MQKSSLYHALWSFDYSAGQKMSPMHFQNM